jgi:type I restriction enzyme S subunit
MSNININNKKKWKNEKLGNLGTFKTSSIDKIIKDDQRLVNLVNYMDVYNKIRFDISCLSRLSKTSVNDKQFLDSNLKKGDILFTPSSETPDDIGHSAVIFDDLPNTVYSYHLVRFRPNVQFDLMFSNYFCNNSNVFKQMYVMSQGATRFTLSLTNFGNIIVSYPSDLNEQHKIGAFLSALDELNEAENIYIDKLNNFKNYILSKIFEKQISFKNISGLKNENWTQSRLGNLGFFKTSSVDKLIKENERVVKLVNYMDVYKKRILNTFVINVLSNTSVKPKQLSENNLKQGDMLFTPSSETPDDIGNSAVILEDLPNTVYSYHLVRFRPKIELDLKFSNYVCNNNFVLKQMRLLAQGATRFTMSLSSMENVIIRYPIDLKEQKRIGSLLTLLDYLITLRIRKNTKLKELKKHYLNLIFNTGE